MLFFYAAMSAAKTPFTWTALHRTKFCWMACSLTSWLCTTCNRALSTRAPPTCASLFAALKLANVNIVMLQLSCDLWLLTAQDHAE
jgi:hypothetical protein